MARAHIEEDMSPLYVPRKRKPPQSHARSAPSCPGVLSAVDHPQIQESTNQNAAKMKRTSERKRYEDLQNVSIGNAAFSASSFLLMSASLTNGLDQESTSPPTAHLSPRVGGAEDVWPEGKEPSWERPKPEERLWSGAQRLAEVWAPARTAPQDQDPVWSSGEEQAWTQRRNREHAGADQAWIPAQEQRWEDQSCDQVWNRGGDPERGWGGCREQTWSNSGEDGGVVWRPDLHVKKTERVEVDHQHPGDNSPPPPGGAVSSSYAAKTIILPPKKEPPTYPAGSQEERWQLLIVAKGRVTCPKCKSVSRKTVEGLKKHMENCRLQPFTCQHCGKQLKSSTGMKYHIMADHSHLSTDDASGLDDRSVKDKLRKVLKRLGKLKCSNEGCSAAFTSIMGYMYHMKKCGKEESELEKLLLNCSHCGKAYRSKAGLEYHLRSEHAPSPRKAEEDEEPQAQSEADPERTPSGRVQRASAQVANFHLAEIANNELPKDWPKRKFQSDLVPDDKKLKYSRPGLPAFSQEVLRKWKNEVKLQRRVQCPNQGCGSTYTSVSGLKAHLGLCTKGEFEAGKYRCLICDKEFNSESGVKYHINSVHSQDWFVTNKKASKKFEKFLKNQPKDGAHHPAGQPIGQCHHQEHHQLHPQHLQHQPLHHLQHQTHFFHIEPQFQRSDFQYTPLEPPPGPAWTDSGEAGPEHIHAQMIDLVKSEEDGDGIVELQPWIKGEREEEAVGVKQEDCFAFSGDAGSSLSQSEATQQRHLDLWSLKRLDAMDGKL